MTVFTTAELAALRECQEAFMSDACRIGTITTTQDSIGQPVPASPVYGNEIACGLQMTGGLQRTEYRNGAMTIVNADAKLRLPHGTSVDVQSVVKVTKRHGSAVTPIVYEIMGEPAVGPSGVVAYLRKVET